jgi:hypothetical protein
VWDPAAASVLLTKWDEMCSSSLGCGTCHQDLGARTGNQYYENCRLKIFCHCSIIQAFSCLIKTLILPFSLVSPLWGIYLPFNPQGPGKNGQICRTTTAKSTFFFVVLGFEFRASHLLGSYSANWVSPPAPEFHNVLILGGAPNPPEVSHWNSHVTDASDSLCPV